GLGPRGDRRRLRARARRAVAARLRRLCPAGGDRSGACRGAERGGDRLAADRRPLRRAAAGRAEPGDRAEPRRRSRHARRPGGGTGARRGARAGAAGLPRRRRRRRRPVPARRPPRRGCGALPQGDRAGAAGARAPLPATTPRRRRGLKIFSWRLSNVGAAVRLSRVETSTPVTSPHHGEPMPTTLTPYLAFNGDTREAFPLYEQAPGATTRPM